MNLFSANKKIIVTCSNRLAPFLEKEIVELGLKPIRNFKTGIELSGTMQDCIQLNLHLRCASQVLFSLYQCHAENGEDLYKEMVRFPWENIIPEDGYFCITSNVNNPSVNNSLYANVKLKDAIADRFIKIKNKRPNSGPDQNKTVIHLFWQENYVEVFADTSGETLSKHGYRKIPGKAPMLESLTAATLIASKWNGTSSFINPMCGSGTIAIEAALKATNRKPGLLRSNYSFMHLVGYEASMYQLKRAQLDQLIKNLPQLKIIASDISEDAINIAQINAGVAGVKELIEFVQCDFEKTPIPENESGAIFFNPEYGDRLGEEVELQATYKRMGDFLKKQCKGYHGYIFTGNLELAKKIGLKPSRRIEFFNGKIDCRLLEYELYSGSREK